MDPVNHISLISPSRHHTQFRSLRGRKLTEMTMDVALGLGCSFLCLPSLVQESRPVGSCPEIHA